MLFLQIDGIAGGGNGSCSRAVWGCRCHQHLLRAFVSLEVVHQSFRKKHEACSIGAQLLEATRAGTRSSDALPELLFQHLTWFPLKSGSKLLGPELLFLPGCKSFSRSLRLLRRRRRAASRPGKTTSMRPHLLPGFSFFRPLSRKIDRPLKGPLQSGGSVYFPSNRSKRTWLSTSHYLP